MQIRKKISQKINGFLVSNPFLRRVRSFFQNKILPAILKMFLAAIIIFVLGFAVIKIFKPEYIEKIHRKVSFNFFKYINLDNREFKKIIITGNDRVSKEKIIEIVKNSKINLSLDDDGNYQPLIKKLVKILKEKLPWVNEITITRNMPDDLNIAITEYQPFAIWQNEGKKYVTDKDGNLIKINDLEEFKHLVILSGEGANKNARSIFNIFTTNPEVSSNVYSATWIGGRRWDIRLENGLLIKLPESGIGDAWQSLVKIYNLPGATDGLKIIDLRIKDKLYLEYDDSSIKKLKNI